MHIATRAEIHLKRIAVILPIELMRSTPLPIASKSSQLKQGRIIDSESTRSQEKQRPGLSVSSPVSVAGSTGDHGLLFGNRTVKQLSHLPTVSQMTD
jgi:hypothetical protein